MTVFGYPARERREAFRTLAAMNRLARIAGPLEKLVADHGEDRR
jgi:hypothetical protein